METNWPAERPKMKTMRSLLVLALVSAGCASGSYVGTRGAEAPGAPGTDDPDISVERPPKEEVPQVNDPNAEHLVLGEDDGPNDEVVGQPKRPAMPSMLPGVITGPGGATPMHVSDE